MRKDWVRTTPLVELSLAELTKLLQPAFRGERVEAREYAHGGLANTNLVVTLAGRAAPLVVRIFTRDPEQAKKELRLLQLLQHRVAVPEVFHLGEDSSVMPYPFMLLEYIQAERLDSIIESNRLDQYATIGSAVGSAAAAIHSVNFDTCGFLDADLNISQPFTVSGAGLISFAEDYLHKRGAAARIGQPLALELLAFLNREANQVDNWHSHPCLAHSDFGPTNMLVDGAGKVAAVLDWEFAFSGHPSFDCGNLFRPPVCNLPGFKSAFTNGYTGAGGRLPECWYEVSLLHDLTAWLDFATRPVLSQELLADIRNTIVSTMEHFKVRRRP